MRCFHRNGIFDWDVRIKAWCVEIMKRKKDKSGSIDATIGVSTTQNVGKYGHATGEYRTYRIIQKTSMKLM